MPWLHAWDGKVKEPQYALFGIFIFQIPAAVLVGEDGTVIAFGDEVQAGSPVGTCLRKIAYRVDNRQTNSSVQSGHGDGPG